MARLRSDLAQVIPHQEHSRAPELRARQLLPLVLLLATACNQPARLAEPPAAKPTEVGRWAVVPATQAPVMNQGSPFFFAWRIDTATGRLEACTYDPGGWQYAPDKPPVNERLHCSAADSPGPG
jgi:hypothetical protein